MTVNDTSAMIPVPFNNETVWAVEREGEILVAVKPICEALGLAWSSQLKRLRRTSILNKKLIIMTIPSPGGPQETVCLPLAHFHGWLFGVETTRVKPAIRPKLEDYQAQCYEVLYRYFRGEIATPEPGIQPTVDIHNAIEANLHPHQLRVLASAKAYGHLGTAEVFHHTGLSEQSNRRALHVLWFLHVVEAWEEDFVVKLRFIPPEKRPGIPMPDLRKPKRLAA